MGEFVNKYHFSKIYKIYSPSNSNLVYYGSTLGNLNTRLSNHKKDYKRCPHSNMTSFKVLCKPDHKIELIEDFKCENLSELLQRESYYIKNNNCVNKVVPYNENYYRVDYECDICNTTINIKSKKRHLRSTLHKLNFNKCKYECKICNKIVNIKSKKNHIKSVSHKLKLLKNKINKKNILIITLYTILKQNINNNI